MDDHEYKVGDRVLYGNLTPTITLDGDIKIEYTHTTAIIVQMDNGEIKIEYNDYNGQRSNAYVDYDEIKIDTQYYRDNRIDEILNEIRLSI